MRIVVLGASGYLGNTIYKKFKECTNDNITGIINISGENPVSHYDFNIYLAELMNIDNSFIISDYKKEDIYHNLNNDKRKYILNTIIRDI